MNLQTYLPLLFAKQENIIDYLDTLLKGGSYVNNAINRKLNRVGKPYSSTMSNKDINLEQYFRMRKTAETNMHLARVSNEPEKEAKWKTLVEKIDDSIQQEVGGRRGEGEYIKETRKPFFKEDKTIHSSRLNNFMILQEEGISSDKVKKYLHSAAFEEMSNIAKHGKIPKETLLASFNNWNKAEQAFDDLMDLKQKVGVENNNWSEQQAMAYGRGYNPDNDREMKEFYEEMYDETFDPKWIMSKN